MTNIAQVSPKVNGCTQTQYEASERAKAEALATAATVTERDFRAMCLKYPLPVLRLASYRYGGVSRGRSYEKVIGGFLAALANPHVNRGDSLAIALGHIEVLYRERERWGIK